MQHRQRSQRSIGGIALALTLVLSSTSLGCDECGGGFVSDSGPGIDATSTDMATPPGDSGVTDSGDATDAAPDGGGDADTGTTDGGNGADASLGTDAGGGTDSGTPGIPDQDGDGISDMDEGGGAVDTDGDLLPDWVDFDSDGDGIPDPIEAGDSDPATPPVDTDGDGTPDFQDTDSDDDGIPDMVEGNIDTDGDGIPNFIDDDSDDDGIPDAVEGLADGDSDGLPNYLDLDSDGDGIPDMVETAVDSDGDGTADFLDLDSDDDGIPDLVEGDTDPEGDGIPSYLDDDSDGDTIPDSVELDADVDGDGTPNFLDLDSDSDAIGDMVELLGDPDGDGTPSFLDIDSDGDTIADAHETAADFDGDGTPNYLDLDSDDDTIADAVEAGDGDPFTPPFDSDIDGSADFLDLDSDDDTILDEEEGVGNPDGDQFPNYRDTDSDGDGLFDFQEAGDALTATPAQDFDGDGIPDYLDMDSDNDYIPDSFEFTNDNDGDGIPDRYDLDSDNDGILDINEAGDTSLSTPPINTDGDTRPDFRDTDSDNDGLTDMIEAAGCPVTSDHTAVDSDGDGFEDLAEVSLGTDPCDPASGIPDFYFVLPFGDNDNQPFDFTTDLQQIDVALNVDTTGSMGGEINNLQNGLSTVVIPGITAAITDSAFAVSEFEDFPDVNFGCELFDGGSCCGNSFPNGDRPFTLLTPVTAVTATAQAAVNMLDAPLGCGRDSPESGFEALYQIGTGAGIIGPINGINPVVAPFVPGPGALGGVGFRTGSFPIVMHITDNLSHTQAQYNAASDTAGFAASRTDAVNALNALSARVFAVHSSATPRTELDNLAIDTNAVIPTCAWSWDPSGGPTARPGGCGVTECCTGSGGTGRAPTAPGGECPLVFRIPSNGTGADQTIVNGVELLVNFSTVDVTIALGDDPGFPGGICMVTAVAPIGFTNPFPGCAPDPVPFDNDPTLLGDDAYSGVTPGMVITFDVQALNNCVMETSSPQVFVVLMDIIADGVTTLDTDSITIIVPPAPPPGSQ